MADERKPSFAQGTQTFFEKNRDNFGSDAKRSGDGHIKPVGTPFQGSPISKYDELKIYHTHNYGRPFEFASRSTFSAAGYALMGTARAEETGTANTVMTASYYARDAANAIIALRDMPRQFQAAGQTVGNIAHSSRNVGRFFEGKELLGPQGQKPLTIKQIDKQLRNDPFSSFERPRIDKKFGTKANLSPSGVQNRILIQTAQAKNLKSDIKALESKGASLTSDERKRLLDLKSQKRTIDEQVRNTHGLKQARENALKRNREADRTSQSSAKKTVRITEKKELRLTKSDKAVVGRLKDRQNLLKTRENWQKAAFARKQLLFSIGSTLGQATRESEEASVRSLTSTSRALQNRHLRSVLKQGIKVPLLTAKAAGKGALTVGKGAYKAGRFLDARFNKGRIGAKIDVGTETVKTIHRSVSQAAGHTKETAVRKILHSRPYHELNGGLYKRAKTKISSKMPDKVKSRIRTASHNIKKANNNARSILNKFNSFKNRLAKTKVGRFVSSVGKGFKSFGNVLNIGKKVVVKIILYAGSAIVGVVLIGALITSVGGVASSFFMTDDVSDEGKIDLSSYIETLNDEQKAINETIASHQSNTEANSGKYNRVYVNYVGGGSNNNYKEILSMAAVYFQQDFSNEDEFDNYIRNLFNESNYVTTSESDEYSCAGCKERDYFCYDVCDEYASAERQKLKETSDHSDERYVGASSDDQKGCKKSALYSCMNKGHGTYRTYGCYQHNNREWMDGPGSCTNYERIEANPNRRPGEEVIYKYRCKGHCSGKHYDYSCPGHTEKVCFKHIDLYVNVVCLSLDKLYTIDPNVSAGVDLGDYKQGDLLGEFNITYYCAEKYPHICNAGPPYKTASGTVVTAGRTIAVDPAVIPLGTPVVINGHVYIAEDTGGAIDGNRIDIAVNTHQEALNLGVDVFKVYSAAAKTEDDNTSSSGSTERTAGLDYEALAQAAETDNFTAYDVACCFAAAKEPAVNSNQALDLESLADKLQTFDINNKSAPFSNAELNTFEYVEMSYKELKAVAKKKDTDNLLNLNPLPRDMICNILIPYDKAHPNEYVSSPEDEEGEGAKQDSDSSLYFEGWNESNKEWVGLILENMTPENYSGLDKIVGGTGIDSSSFNLEGITIQGSKINVKYYSQHDSRWANSPVNANIPQTPNSNRMTTSGCGFATMSIVVSSLTSNDVAPPAMCARFGPSHYFGNGAAHSLISNVSSAYGLSCTEIAKSNIQGAVDALSEGKLVVALVGRGGWGWTGDGYYRGNGHFLVICGVTEDGSFLLADPNNVSVSINSQPVSMNYFVASGIGKLWIIGK